MINFYIFTSILAVSLVSLLGMLLLAGDRRRIKSVIFFLVSVSAGSMIGGAFFHLLPEAVGIHPEGLRVWVSLTLGFVAFFVLEKLICWRHCHIPTSHEHPHELGIMNLVGDGLHNLIDGMVIAGAYMASLPLGAATTLAVVLHEVPQEISDFGVLLYAGYTKKRALVLNYASAATAFLGGAAGIFLASRSEDFLAFILPFTAGGFIYIASADLIPELKKENAIGKSMKQLAGILFGIGIMLALRAFGGS